MGQQRAYKSLSIGLASLAFGGCIATGASSFYLGTVQQASTAYSGSLFASSPTYGFFRLSDGASYSLVDDTFTLSAYLDSACTSAAPGSFTISSSTQASSQGRAAFSGMSYTWPDNRYEGKLYFRIRTAKKGLDYCSSYTGITQRFNTGSGYYTSGTTGVSGLSGATEYDIALGQAIDSQGRIILGGYSAKAGGGKQMAAWRMFPNGTLDTSATYGTTGAAGQTGANEGDQISAVLVDSQDRYIFIGRSANLQSVSTATGYEVAVWRYKADFTLDASFGTGGVYHSTAAANGALAGTASAFDVGLGGAIDSSGNIIVAGLSNRGGAGNPNEFTVWKLDSTGTPVGTFGTGGIYHIGATGFSNAGTSQRDNVFGVAIDSQGRYVFGGSARNSSAGREIGLIRMDSNGNVDSTFGGGLGAMAGTYRSGSTGAAGASGAANVWEVPAYQLKLDSSGRIYLGGMSKNASGGYQATFWRYTANGVPDTSWGTNGYTTFSTSPQGASAATMDDEIYAIELDSAGNLIGAGDSMVSGASDKWAIWRVTSTGAIDTSFGTGGTGYVYRTASASLAGGTAGNAVDWFQGFNIDQFGRYAVSGVAVNSSGGHEMAVARFWSTGVIDN